MASTRPDRRVTTVLTSILLILTLPDLDGSVVCGAVREFIAVPIIMLTARVD